MKRVQLFLAILLLTLGIQTTASANNVTVALTALVQTSSTNPNPGIYAYTSTKVRITTKEILAWLASIGYIVEDKTTLTYYYSTFHSDGFYLRTERVAMVIIEPINASTLELFHSIPQVRNGNIDENTEIEKYTEQVPVEFGIDIDPGTYFLLRGLADTNQKRNGTSESSSINIKLMGSGAIPGGNCTISGKMRIRNSGIMPEP